MAWQNAYLAKLNQHCVSLNTQLGPTQRFGTCWDNAIWRINGHPLNEMLHSRATTELVCIHTQTMLMCSIGCIVYSFITSVSESIEVMFAYYIYLAGVPFANAYGAYCARGYNCLLLDARSLICVVTSATRVFPSIWSMVKHYGWKRPFHILEEFSRRAWQCILP